MKKYIFTIALSFAISSQAFSQSEPPYGMSEIQAYSIFYENFRTGDYDMALQFGKWMLEKKPETIQGVNRFSLPRQFERMITVYAELSKRETDPSMRSAYIDSALVVYDDAFEYFDEEQIDLYTWHFNRGRFYQEHQSIIRDGMDKAFEDYEKAFELDREKLVQAGDGYYVQIILNNYISNSERDRAMSFIDEVEPLANAALNDILDDARDNLFDNPEERVGFLESRLADNPDDMAIITELASMYESMGNRAKAIEFAEKLYNNDKTIENARRLADYAKADGQDSKAIQYLVEGLELTNDNNVKKNINLEISELYQNDGNLRTARQYARAASRIDSNWGQPYLRISSIYASAISQCTTGRQIDRDDRTVYWLVLDYLDRARSVDSSVASTVTRRYSTYEPVVPTAEDKFFRSWEPGDQFRIDGSLNQCYAWIDEVTTIR